MLTKHSEEAILDTYWSLPTAGTYLLNRPWSGPLLFFQRAANPVERR